MKSSALRWSLGGLLFVSLGLQVACAQDASPPPRIPAIGPVSPSAGPAAAPTATDSEHTEFQPAVDTERHECGHFFTQAEYLLLQARRRSLDYVVADPNQSGTVQGSIVSVSWESESGVRAGGGYRLPDGWEIRAFYTYYYAAGDSTVSAPPGGTLYPTLTHPGFISMVDTATASSRLNYQIADLEIGHCFHCGDSATFWVGGGGRFAWIDQTLTALYDGSSASNDQVTSPINFNGYGLRCGAEAQWLIAHGLGVYGRAFGSLLVGNFNTNLSETDNSGAAVLTQVNDHFTKVIPVAEMSMGLSWQSESLRLQLGYEITNWFGLVDSSDIVHDFSNKPSHRVSDLSLEGLNVRLEYDY
jgi:hypothetical protein